jgi:serine/threonine protein kinase
MQEKFIPLVQILQDRRMRNSGWSEGLSIGDPQRQPFRCARQLCCRVPRDNLAHVTYPGGVSKDDWVHDLPLLIEETWSRKKLAGPYELTELLGSGGNAEVYKAIDTRLNRTVAIKLLKGPGQ